VRASFRKAPTVMVRPCPELAGDSKPMDKARGLQPSDVVHEDNSSVVKAKVEVFKEFDLNLFSLETQRFAKLTTGN
jgi:hypothetical protein